MMNFMIFEIFEIFIIFDDFQKFPGSNLNSWRDFLPGYGSKSIWDEISKTIKFLSISSFLIGSSAYPGTPNTPRKKFSQTCH